MFDKFRVSYTVDGHSKPSISNEFEKSSEQGFNELFSEFGGKSFNGAIYRIMDLASSKKWTSLLVKTYPKYENRINCFGFDWQGCIFATDSAIPEENLPGVRIFEPDTAETLITSTNIFTFHEDLLITDPGAGLKSLFYSDWRSSGGKEPEYYECINFKQFLFLGGKFALDNLECSDMDVHWNIASQVILTIKNSQR